MSSVDQQPPRGEQAVALALDRLEHLASSDWPSACRQMVALYPVASEMFIHDVCDRIDLWIANEGLPSDSADHLTEQIALESDDSLKRHYRGWLDLSRPVREAPSEPAFYEPVEVKSPG